MKSIFIVFTIVFCQSLYAQLDSSFIKRKDTDTLKSMNMDAVYNRPFLTFGKTPVALGGYLEANWQYTNIDGISEGHQLQARRLTLFISSSIGQRMNFLTEIEFEDGGNAIALEFASLDVHFHPLFNLRGGIILNPIASFNQNHDGPKWEFVDRPLVSTQMLPATWSNSGFGIFGKYYFKKWMLGYELYLSGGFDNSIVDNEENKTFLPAAKQNPKRFEEINSGLPLSTGKLAFKHLTFGEIGISYMGHVYNQFRLDGMNIDIKRRVDLYALDLNFKIPFTNTQMIGEYAMVFVQTPENSLQNFGTKQNGAFLDIVQPILNRKILGWNKAQLLFSCRIDWVDWNRDKIRETGENIGDQYWSIMPAISFRPSQQTVFRLNYRIGRQIDFLNNPASQIGTVQLGFSTYF